MNQFSMWGSKAPRTGRDSILTASSHGPTRYQDAYLWNTVVFQRKNMHEMVKNVQNTSVAINKDTRKNKTMEILAN